jgi:hypothetical protein
VNQKILLLVSILLMGIVSTAADLGHLGVTRSIIVGSVHANDKFLFIVSKDCSQISAIPTQMRINREESFARVLNAGADKRTRIIELVLLLEPLQSSPSKEETQQSLGKIGCDPSVRSSFQSYPDIYQTLGFPFPYDPSKVPLLVVQSRSNGAKVFRIRFDSQRMVSAEALETLSQIWRTASLKIKFFELKEIASTKIRIEPKTVAEFEKTHFVERTCNATKICGKLAGRVIQCEEQISCTEAPRVAQFLKSIESTLTSKMESTSLGGGADKILEELENEIVNRMLRSLFAIRMRESAGDASKIILGKMKTIFKDVYEDRLVREEIVAVVHTDGVSIEQPISFASAELKKIW